MRVIKKLLQKIRCSIPFSPFNFHHKPLRKVKELSDNTDLVICTSCNQLFTMNHSAEIILPWKDVADFYTNILPNLTTINNKKERTSL